MNLIKSYSDGVRLIQLPRFDDARGSFVKTFCRSKLEKWGMDPVFEESYFSISKKNVLRGMHFQNPPHDHSKLVFVVNGIVRDVILDIRKNSSRYGKTRNFELSGENRYALYIPKGFAHGFIALEDDTTMYYFVSTEYAPDFDCGIMWDSFGFDWGCESPVLSERDKQHENFQKFKSRF